MIRSRIPLVPVAAAVVVGCNGNCSQNAVLITTQAQQFAPVVDTIEVYTDSNGDGLVGPADLSERGFVVDARSGLKKILRITFLLPQPRASLEAGTDDEPKFLTFSSFVQPPMGSNWVTGMYFCDDPNDTSTSEIGSCGTASSASATVVTYVLYEDLVAPPLATNALPVSVTIGLDQLPGSGSSPFNFAFVLGRLFGLDGDAHLPPRIVGVTPTPATPLPGWGRAINQQDLTAAQTLDQLLATVDNNFIGTTLGERISPHQRVSFTFDKPMVNMVATVTPFPAMPTVTDAAGIELSAPTIGFLTPFTEADSDTSIGMAPDQTYSISALSDSGMAFVPVWRGTEGDQGQYLTAAFDDTLYQALRAQGYTEADLSNHSTYTFRTGPFRITSPVHHQFTNATTAPNGVFTAHLQFATPAEGAPSPTRVVVTVSPNSAASTTTTVGFPTGTADTISQDGCVRSSGTVSGPNAGKCNTSPSVTIHDIPIQLPAQDYDDFVHLAIDVYSGPSPTDLVGKDAIDFLHDVTIPTIDQGSVQFTNTYENQLDTLCVVADCDVISFELSTNESTACTCGFPLPCTPTCAIAGESCMSTGASGSRCAIPLSRQQAQVGACTNGKQQFCFSNVSLGIASTSLEDSVTVTLAAVDHADNVSPPVTFTTAPTCRELEKFVGRDGRRSAVATADDGSPLVAWTDGTALKYAERVRPPSLNAGQWSSRTATIAHAAGTFGLGIDMALHPVDRRPVVCFIDANVDKTGDANATGTLHVVEQDAQGNWQELGSRPGVQPLGCSMSSLGFGPIVGWLEGGNPMWGFALNLQDSALVLPLPPSTIPRANHQIWDLDIIGFEDRVWFAYRTAHPTSTAPSAPGTIMVGYSNIFGSRTDLHAVCPTADGCNKFANFVTYGWGPQIIADSSGFALSFISVEDSGIDTFNVEPQLQIVTGPLGTLGDPITFGPHHSDFSRSLVDVTGDGLSSGALEVPFSEPSLIRDFGSPILYASWARGPNFGQEDVAVLHWNPQDNTSFVTTIERRVEGSNNRNEVVPSHLSGGPNGFHLVYRDGAANRLVFAAEQETLPLSGVPPAGHFACPQEWSNSGISVDTLNLKYANADNLWDNACAGTTRSPTRPVFGQGLDKLADPSNPNASVLHDLVVNQVGNTGYELSIQNGRVPQTPQFRVCLPATAGSPPTGFDDRICDPLETLLLQSVPPLVSVSCAVGNSSCAVDADCCSGSCKHGACDATGTPAGCPSVSAADLKVGDMNWIPSVDGHECSRCPPGGALHACRTNADCLVFGGFSAANDNATSPARCAADGWNGRSNAPNGQVCVPRCSTDADCLDSTGTQHFCDNSNPKDPGICRTRTSSCTGGDCPEDPAATTLECRPIGCDSCFNNDYCDGDDGDPAKLHSCPHNHYCYGSHEGETTDPHYAPTCVLRPILAPSQEALLGTLTTDEQQALDDARTQAQQLLSRVELPNRIPLDLPLVDCDMTGFGASVHDVNITMNDDLVDLTISLGPATIYLCSRLTNPKLLTIDDGWKVHLYYAPFIASESRESISFDASNAYSGLSFNFTGVKVEGNLNTNCAFGCCLVDQCPDISALSGPLRDSLQDFADQAMTTIIRVAGGLRQDGNGHLTLPGITACTVRTGDSLEFTNMPRQCSRAGLPDADFPELWSVATSSNGIVVNYPVCP